MKPLCICGTESLGFSIEELKQKGFEIWMLGVDSRDGADVYYELHGVPSPHECIRGLPQSVYEQGLPINNSISALIVLAVLKGYKEIHVLGSPMMGREEYEEQRPALGFVCGWANGVGVFCDWVDLPKNKNYGQAQ